MLCSYTYIAFFFFLSEHFSDLFHYIYEIDINSKPYGSVSNNNYYLNEKKLQQR